MQSDAAAHSRNKWLMSHHKDESWRWSHTVLILSLSFHFFIHQRGKRSIWSLKAAFPDRNICHTVALPWSGCFMQHEMWHHPVLWIRRYMKRTSSSLVDSTMHWNMANAQWDAGAFKWSLKRWRRVQYLHFPLNGRLLLGSVLVTCLPLLSLAPSRFPCVAMQSGDLEETHQINVYDFTAALLRWSFYSCLLSGSWQMSVYVHVHLI